MPLITTGKPGTHDSEQAAIAFWMKVEGASPDKAIRVFVTYPALWDMDPSQLRDQHAAFETFERNRELIEAAASKKFDKEGVADGTYDGQPILRVDSNDL